MVGEAVLATSIVGGGGGGDWFSLVHIKTHDPLDDEHLPPRGWLIMSPNFCDRDHARVIACVSRVVALL